MKINSCVYPKKTTLILSLLAIMGFAFTSHAQTLTLEELLSFPSAGIDKTEASLKAKGWESYNVEFKTDSNLVKKTWVIANKYNDLKSYVQYYDFQKKQDENYMWYQYSDRKAYEVIISDLKKMGFKNLSEKSKKKKRKKDNPNLYKEKQDLWLSDQKKSLIVLREVFVYGMNAFVIYSHSSKSQTAMDLIAQEK